MGLSPRSVGAGPGPGSKQGADQVGRALCKALVEQWSVFTVVERWLPATLQAGLRAAGSERWWVCVPAGLWAGWSVGWTIDVPTCL